MANIVVKALVVLLAVVVFIKTTVLVVRAYRRSKLMAEMEEVGEGHLVKTLSDQPGSNHGYTSDGMTCEDVKLGRGPRL